MDVSNTSWKDFYNFYKRTFEEDIQIELAYAATFEESYIYRENSFLKDLLHILKYAIFSCVKLKKSYPHSKSYRGIFAINLARPNDFGLIFPILEKYEKSEDTLLIIKKDCFEKEIHNIKKLKKTKVLFKEELMPLFSLLGFIKTLLNGFKAYKTLKNTSDDSFYRNYLKKRRLAFIKHFLNLSSISNILKDTINFTKTDFIFSLGERRYGLIAHQLKIKHIAYQHGNFSTKSISCWPMFTPGNVNEIFVYGNHFKSIVEKVFPDNINKVKVFGNSSYDGIQTKKIIKKKNDPLKIVFFSSTHGYLKIDEELVNNSLDCLVNLKKEFNNKLDLKIKLHPNESDEYILNYNGLFGNDIKLYNDSIPLKEIFENTDICFAWTSSTNLEGVFFNCIAVQLNLGKFELSMQDFSKRINNYEELVLFISNLNKNEEFYNEILNLQREKAKDYFDNYSNVSKLIVKYLNKE